MVSNARTKRLIAAAAVLLLAAAPARADEGGVAFWLSGQMGSLAAVPGEPGWSVPVVYYHLSADEGASKSFPIGGRVTAGIDVRTDLVLLVPTYTFASSVAGGQASVGLGMGGARVNVGVDATLTGPGGGVLSGSEQDRLDGVADLYPTASLKWNHGVHNTMAYMMGGVPVGSYSTGRLANLGTNHWSLDGGGGYTYFDSKRGHEASVVVGATYNFENPDTDYQNGIDLHVDWAVSQFFSAQLHAGLVGYFYQQLTGDSGAGATLGDFKSRVAAIGPQVGYFFPVGNKKWYANLKAYSEFNAQNRPEGWNLWVSLLIPLGS